MVYNLWDDVAFFDFVQEVVMDRDVFDFGIFLAIFLPGFLLRHPRLKSVMPEEVIDINLI